MYLLFVCLIYFIFPSLLFVYFVNYYFQISEPAKLLVSTLMKNTALIDDRDLAFEAYLVNWYICEKYYFEPSVSFYIY